MATEEKLDFDFGAFFDLDDALDDNVPAPDDEPESNDAFEQKEPSPEPPRPDLVVREEMSVAEQLTESDVLKDLLSGNLSEETRLKCVQVLGCEPINLMRDDIKNGLIKKCPQLEEQFKEESGIMFNFYSGINLGSMKLYNSIMEAAIARTCLDNLVSTMNSGTIGREEVADFANELQLLFIQFAEKTQTFVLGMAKTTGVLAQASTALDYGADASCLLQVVSRVIGEVSKEIQSVEESRQLTNDKIMQAQRFLKVSMVGNTGEYEQLEMSVVRHEDLWNDAIVKRRTFRELFFKEKMDASAAKALAESRIASIAAGIDFCKEAKKRTLIRKQKCEESLAKYDELDRKLVAERYKEKECPDPPNYVEIAEQLRTKSGINTNFENVRSKLQAKADERRDALLQRYDNMGKAEAKDLVDVEEMKNDLSKNMSEEITERKGAIQKNIDNVEEEIKELLKLEQEALKPPPQENEETTGGWWAHKKQQDTQDQMIQDLEDREKFLRKAKASLEEKQTTRNNQRVEMEVEASKASTGKVLEAVSSSSTTKKSFWRGRRTTSSNTYAMVQKNPNVREGLENAAKSIQGDIDAIIKQIASIETELADIVDKKQKAYERKQQIDEMKQNQNNERLQTLRSDRETKQQQKADLIVELSKVSGEVEDNLREAHDEALRQARIANREAEEEARQANERRERQRDAAFNNLVDQQTNSMTAILEQVRARDKEVAEQISRTIETLKDAYIETANQIRKLNAAGQLAFDNYKAKALQQVNLQREALKKSIGACEIEFTKIDLQIESRLLQQDNERSALVAAQTRLGELKDGAGSWVRGMKTLTARETTAKTNYGTAVQKLEELQRKFDVTNKTQFANMRRALELLSVSTQHLPMALTCMNGVFQQTETALGGETFAEMMAIMPDKKAFLKDFTKAMQLICRIGWAMFDRPIQSLMTVQSAQILASLRVEPPLPNGPIIEEVDDASVTQKMIAYDD